ncbi:hypothetical protein [Rhodocyclus tenuis]|uniref:Uncharacterized protein n=1 Tax=Rhodocyclus tenuis TaxID=1066 RepID=A0A840G921_RHOTE|nr:hypothetical protein [Rhodocyclus tenuis]MBB4248346.1 hypothetical protein [Rhodocyclus tenuis]
MSDITRLRSALFATLDDLRDPAKTIDLDRVKAINETAKNITDTAKVEVNFLRVTGAAEGSGFIPTYKPALPGGTSESQSTATGTKTIEHVPGGTKITHRLK